MEARDYIEANRQSWDEAAPVHAAQKLADLLAGFTKPGYSCLDEIETAILEKIGVKGKAVAQLCCNNGREVLSVVNMGAARGIGFDISEAFLDQGRQMAKAGNIAGEFVQGSVYDIPASFDGQFDLVTVTIGAFGWLPDIDGFFAVAARLLKPGGHIFIYETHPVLDMFEPGEEKNPLDVKYSYFMSEPFRSDDGLDYYGGKRYAGKPNYWFHHKMSDIIGACLAHGLALEHFREYDFDISGVHGALAQQANRPPMSYTLVARKAAAV
jgi:ubiquinone/menaquinone biosynthesis C-methylase UbiE